MATSTDLRVAEDLRQQLGDRQQQLENLQAEVERAERARNEVEGELAELRELIEHVESK